MKNLRKLAIITITFIIFTLLLVTKSLATTGTINEDTVNLRSEASTSSKILRQLDKGEELEILEDLGEWYKVKYNSSTGYISKKLMTVKEETPSNSVEEIDEQNQVENNAEQENNEKIEITVGTAYTINSNIEVKIIPLMNAIKSTQIQTNTSITVTDSMNNWYYVETNNTNGWIRKQLLENVISLEQTTQPNNNQDEQKPEDKQPQPEENKPTEQVNYTEYETPKTGYISGSTVNFRTESSTTSSIIKKLTKNTEVKILGKTTNNWYKITVDGKTGYVSAEYVSDTKVAEPSSRGMSSSQVNNIETQVQNQQEPEPVVSQENTQTNLNSDIGSQIVAYAKTFLGTKYVSGGSTPSSGFDCSGFTKYVYAHFGITLNRSSSAQINNGVAISKSELVPGDLLIFNGSSNKSVGHVGIYIGNNQFIHASNPSDGVKITSLSDSYYVERYVGARRVF